MAFNRKGTQVSWMNQYSVSDNRWSDDVSKIKPMFFTLFLERVKEERTRKKSEDACMLIYCKVQF